MKFSTFASMAAVFLSISVFAGACLQKANPVASSALTREQALQTIWRAPNFSGLVSTLENSGDELDFGKAAFVPTTKGSRYKILVIKSESDSKVVEAVFDFTTLLGLVLIAPPNTVVNVLTGTVQKLDLTRRATRHNEEGAWKGTASLTDMTTIAPSTSIRRR